MRALPLALAAALAACDRAPDAAPPAPDATVDAAPADRPAPDAAADLPPADRTDAAPDAAADAAPDADLRPYDPCAPGAVRDLDAVGVRAGASVRALGDNLSVGRAGPLDAPCAAGFVGHEVVYRYVPRATGRLRVSTNDEATDPRLDTVVFVLRACGPTGDGGAAVIGCGDDTGSPPRDHASGFVTDADVTAGVAVYIVVGGFLHATRELWESQGRFALTVTELAARP